jgi:hypothetical protein
LHTYNPGFAFFPILYKPGSATGRINPENRRWRVKVHCKGCRIAFDIPDDKALAGKGIEVLCPRCKEPAVIEEKADPVVFDDHVPHTAETFQSDANLDQFLDYENEIDLVDDEVKTALLCDTNLKRAEKIAQALQELDFWVVHAMRPAFALGKLHHNDYEVVLLEENFNSEKESRNLVLHHMQVIPMHLRRRFYLCLISEDKPTLNSKLAFRMGINMVLNSRDIDKAKVLLARALKEYKSFYSIYNMELARRR